MQTTKQLNSSDLIINFIDTTLRTLFSQPITTNRPNPAKDIINPSLNNLNINKIIGFMRVNHCGEVCAQALYQGQALTARNYEIKLTLRQAAEEENDHLVWCQDRLKELNSHTSYLNPLWYCGSLVIGVFAGLAGDKYNLGFLAETEKQVSKHLTEHLEKWPINDYKSKAIIKQMRIDEQNHANTATEAGGSNLPIPVKYFMQFSAKIMTTIAYYI
ncbi:MAG: 2-polyprenyl-3-methyl-6-methoxy-1,4-benzoquinone monooxygenase [Gammaproteobacteria bacterium]|nr:2-polyprenyl-3-methyl-6-methoxy-1,4-benzoquinone monooxygenase [Gammaproteobacteria bacterium]